MNPQQSTTRKTDKPAAAVGSTANGRPEPAPGSLPLPPDQLQELHRYLKLCREFDQKMVDMFKAGQLLGTYFSAVGQEACDIVPGFFCREQDDVFCPSHRDLAGAIVRDCPIEVLARNMFSRATAQDRGFSHPVFWGYTEGNFLVPSSVIANQYTVAVGVAMAYKMRGMKNVSIIALGEGGSSKGDLYEAMNFAGLHRLPVIFIIQNNWWAESVPIHLQSAVEDLTLRAIGFNMPGIRLNGNDVPRMIGPCQEAADRARNGGGPTLFQFDTYRWYGHSSIDPANYRDETELEFWKAQDPIATYESWLVQQGVFTEDQLKAREQEIRDHIDNAIRSIMSEPDPEAKSYLDYVYAPGGELPAPIQKRWQGWDGRKVS